MVTPHVDKHSSLKQIRLEIQSGRRKELLSGLIALHHPNGTDKLYYIYLSDQQILLLEDDLFKGGYISNTNSKWTDLRMTLCMNKTVRSDGELATLFLDDIRNHTFEVTQQIREVEAKISEISYRQEFEQPRRNESMNIQVRFCNFDFFYPTKFLNIKLESIT